MQICNRCILPETFPDISFDAEGICNYCREYDTRQEKAEVFHSFFRDEASLKGTFEKVLSKDRKYDVLVSLSGGVDSSYSLIKMVETYNLRALAFHNDFGYKDDTAVNNVRNLCKALKTDYLIWRNDYEFMKKIWRYVNEAYVPGMSACYFCGNMVSLNALELADSFGIKMVVNGLSKGQAWTMNHVERTRSMMNEMVKIVSADKEFFDIFMRKNEYLARQRILRDKEDLFSLPDSDKILVIPFFIFKFYKTDKETLKRECRERFDWREPVTTYPRRTTNCEMAWLNSFCDIKKMGYSTYHEEYAQLVREKEMTREQALADLDFSPPGGLIDDLAEEIGMDTDFFPFD